MAEAKRTTFKRRTKQKKPDEQSMVSSNCDLNFVVRNELVCECIYSVEE